jgi:hypothetical protein
MGAPPDAANWAAPAGSIRWHLGNRSANFLFVVWRAKYLGQFKTELKRGICVNRVNQKIKIP